MFNINFSKQAKKRFKANERKIQKVLKAENAKKERDEFARKSTFGAILQEVLKPHED